MSGLIETLWQQFAVEASEHFDAIERHLSASAADGGSLPDRERVAALFRAFHSLKGAARAMDLFAMEGLAHRAESVLGRVRAGALALGPEIVETMLEALDALRGLSDLAVRERRDGTPNPALLKRLESLGHPDGAADAAPPSVAPTARLHDNERLLGMFVDNLREGMATLTRALDLDTLDTAAATAVDDTAERLEIGCERLSFLPFADTLRGFRAALAARDPDGILRELQAIAQASARVGRLSRRDAGTAILSTLLADHNAQAVARLAERAVALLEQPAAARAELPPLLDRLAGLLDIGRLPRAASLLRGIADTVRRTEDGSGTRLRPLLAEAGPLVTAIVRGAAADPSEDVDGESAARLEAALQSFADGAAEETAARPLAAADLAALGLDPQIQRFLSPDSRALLERALGDPTLALYEVTAFLESDAALASSFAGWLGSGVTAITNWPQFVDGRTWLHVLIASPEEPEALRNTLASFDPAGQFLRLRPCTAGSGQAPALPATPTDSGRPAESAPVPAAPAAAEPAGPAALVPVQPEAVPAENRRAPATAHLRVAGETVDRFMARIDSLALLSGELTALAADTRLAEAVARLTERLGSGDPDLRLVHERLERAHLGIAELDQQLSRSVDRLREAALDLRVVPVESLFNQFPRVVREFARLQGKRVRLEFEGGEVRIDKSMVEQLYDPLMHMVRNAVDHGIEPPDERERAGKPAQAVLRFAARQRGNRVEVAIADDGRGIDAERVRARAVRNGLIGESESHDLPEEALLDFIFAPGFSTVEAVTETSGRGVGMDVVRETVVRLGGTVAIRTVSGAGTAFTIDLPLSAAIVRTLLVQVGTQVLAIPDRAVEEVCGFRAAEFHRVAGCRTVLRRDRMLPVVPLAACLGFAGGAEPPPEAQRLIVVLRQGERRIGVEIERLLRRGDLFVRDSHPALTSLPGLGGVSLLNDGRIVLILDGDGLFRLACAAQVRELERDRAAAHLPAVPV